MRSALWPEDTFVDFEHGVNTAVKKLRQALEDSAEHPRFVETLPKIGYRFIVPVEWETDARARTTPSVVPIAQPKPILVPPPVPPERHWKLKAAIAFAALAVVTAGVLLSNENSGLSRTRLGAWVRQIVLRRHAEPQRAVIQRRLTANPDDTPLTGGVISPDGKYLAYTDSSGLYLRQVDGGETHPIPLPKDFEALPESWFPDSSHLVVTWFGFQKNPRSSEIPRELPSLWKISILGGTPRKLADEGSSARVSPDGLKIAFLTGPWDNEQIWLMDADGGGARKIVDGGQESFGAVAWASDGKKFATVRSTPTGRQIEVYDVANGHSDVILSDPRLGEEVAWTSTGRLIYSLLEPEPNQNDANVWSVQLDPRSARPVSPPTRITNDRARIMGISAAADGKRLALRRSSYQADVYLTELKAQGKQMSPPQRFTLDERWDWPSSWTPDSKAVLYMSDRDGPNHIFKQKIDETQPELLVGGEDIVWVPRLTPDGSSVLYLTGALPGQPPETTRLMRVPLSGGPSQFVLEGPGITNYECARLPSTLCVYGQFEPRAEYYKFFTFDPAGAKGRELSAARMKREDANGSNWWGLSPDGKYLVIAQSLDPYKFRIPAVRILNLAEGTERVIPVPEAGLIMGMDWAADSESVWVSAYRGRGAWGTRSGVLNIDLTGKVSVVYEGINLELWFAIPSPDGRRLALLEHTQSSNMWLLENF